MSEPQNVQIPLALFKKIIRFFEYASISNYEFPSLFHHGDILSELRDKQHRINMRDAYTAIKHSRDYSEKYRAVSNYSKLRNKPR